MAEAMVVIYQRLAYEWGRAGWSAPMTARRRTLPKVYPLPAITLPGNVVSLAQNVDWSDADAFAHAHESVLHYAELKALEAPALEVLPGQDAVEVLPTPVMGLGDTPQRLKLAVGQVARYEWNERLEGLEPRFRHTIISVTLSPRTVKPGALMRLPDFYKSHMVDLNERRHRAGRAV